MAAYGRISVLSGEIMAEKKENKTAASAYAKAIEK